MISYLTFLLKSSNQHGVHSPFVYNFVTQGLYKNKASHINLNEHNINTNLSKKEEKILRKIINHFETAIITTDLNIKSDTLDKSFKLLYFSSLNSKLINKISINNPNSFIVLKNIHQDKASQENWYKIIKLENATVTIDLFYFGLIFFRKEQAKEHFNIRPRLF